MDRSRGRRRLIAAAPSVAGHLAILAALYFAKAAPLVPEPPPIIVELVEPRVLVPQAPTPAPEPPTPAVAPPKPETPAPAKPPPRAIARPTPNPPPEIAPIAAGKSPGVAGEDEVSDGDLASAATAGAGAPGGGECDMVGHLQDRLRRDRQVQSAMAEANRGKAIRVWNGAWVRHPGQDGAGLAAVREAIMWEVAFAPAACRARPVRGLVLIALDDAPGAARVVLGAGTWRWSDLLFVRGETSTGESFRR